MLQHIVTSWTTLMAETPSPLLHSSGDVQWGWRLDASAVQKVLGTCLPKVSLLIGTSWFLGSHLRHGSLGSCKCPTKWHLDWFSQLCRAHSHDKHTDRQRQTDSICRNGQHLVLSVAIRAENWRTNLLLKDLQTAVHQLTLLEWSMCFY